jgi:hypothetical protein
VASCLNALAVVMCRLERLDDALGLFEEAIEIQTRLNGEDSAEVLSSVATDAQLLYATSSHLIVHSERLSTKRGCSRCPKG